MDVMLDMGWKTLWPIREVEFKIFGVKYDVGKFWDNFFFYEWNKEKEILLLYFFYEYSGTSISVVLFKIFGIKAQFM